MPKLMIFNYYFINYPNIKHIFFNGSKAYETYNRKVGFTGDMRYIKLLSTSPANAIKYDIKIENWMIIKANKDK